ncbi:MAG: peptidase [Verrucomicrobiales bacterium]|nr:peptidase [Verrucomicrobiales bacterium]
MKTENSFVPSWSPLTTVRSLNRFLNELNQLSHENKSLVYRPLGPLQGKEGDFHVPRYVYFGPKNGGETIRLALFAGLHGDELEGTFALINLVKLLLANPELGKGYALFIYPICNPTGFENGTATNSSGRELEFWSKNSELEVQLLQNEIWTHAFHGLITLQSDPLASGIYGFATGTVLSEHLLEPALIAAETFLPRNRRSQVDGFPSNNGIIQSEFPGMLRGVPGLSPAPFEVLLKTPRMAPLHRQVNATVAALRIILDEYRFLQTIGANI